VLQEQVAHLEHVEDAVVVASHSSMASASTRCATLGRSPRSVTTSTLRWRRSWRSTEKAAEIEQAALWLEVHQEVDLAVVTGIAAGDGAEHPHPRRTAGAGDLDDVVAALAQLGQGRTGHRQDNSDASSQPG
jgi:hypothetical protein